MSVPGEPLAGQNTGQAESQSAQISSYNRPLPPPAIPQGRVWLTYLLLAGLAAGYSLELSLEGGLNALSLAHDLLPATLYQAGGLYRPAIMGGEYWRLLSVMFIHANLIHLLLNAVLLLVLGWRLELYLGAGQVGLIYFMSGLSASIFSFCFSLNNRDLSVGASGAIFGLAGALAGFSLRNWGMLYRQFWLLAAALLINLTLLGAMVKGVDNWAHLGGILAGLWLSLLSPSRSTASAALNGGHFHPRIYFTTWLHTYLRLTLAVLTLLAALASLFGLFH